MAVYPTYTVTDLAAFTGRPAAKFKPYVGQAIREAVRMFKIATCLKTVWPDDPDDAELAEFAVLAMADSLYLSGQYVEQAATPYNAESMGGYSYTRQGTKENSLQTAIAKGSETGVRWFDLAVRQLGVCSIVQRNIRGPMSSGITVFNPLTPESGASRWGRNPEDHLTSRSLNDAIFGTPLNSEDSGFIETAELIEGVELLPGFEAEG